MPGDAALTAEDLEGMSADMASLFNGEVELIAFSSDTDVLGDSLGRVPRVVRSMDALWVDQAGSARWLGDRLAQEIDQILVLALDADLSDDETLGKVVAYRNPATGVSFTRIGDNLDRSNRSNLILTLRASDLRGL